MLEDMTLGAKPDIVISDADQHRLTDLAMAALDRNPAVAEVLLAEIERSTVVPDASMPADVVRMGSTVDYDTQDGSGREVTLVFPGEADITTGKISILTPIGAALIGLRTGQSIDWVTREGRSRRLTVVAVRQRAG